MALTEAFYEAVKNGNLLRVRIMMKDSLLVDPSFRQFEEMEKAASSMKDLYQNHDGRKFETDKNLWNDEYMNTLMVQVISNFSRERIKHLKDVVSYLRPTKKTGPSSDETKRSGAKWDYEEQKRRDQEKGNIRIVKVSVAATVGAVAGGVISTVAGGNLITGAAVGAVICAAATFAATMGGR